MKQLSEAAGKRERRLQGRKEREEREERRVCATVERGKWRQLSGRGEWRERRGD